MRDVQLWHWVVVGLVAIASVGFMSVTIARMFSRAANQFGGVRKATDLESGLVGAEVPPGTRAFDAWSYRVPARFAGRARIVIDGEKVSVAGPRVASGLYRTWIWVQGLLLALVPVALAWALVRLSWRSLVLGFALFSVSWLVSTLGAGLWPGLGEIASVEDGHFKAVEFSRSSVSDVAIGEGWARGGLEVVLLPYKKGIDGMAAGRAVSFFAPDGEGRQVRYALHMHSTEEAEEVARLLR